MKINKQGVRMVTLYRNGEFEAHKIYDKPEDIGENLFSPRILAWNSRRRSSVRILARVILLERSIFE